MSTRASAEPNLTEPNPAASGPVGARHLTAGDTAALRALAHPVRLAILGALRTDGPATVGDVASAHGIAAGSASYHLRTLAQHGFVEETGAPAGARASDRRTRWWRSVARTTDWDPSDFDDSPAGAAAAAAFARSIVDVLHARAVEAVERREELDVPWREAQYLADDQLWLSLEDTSALRADIEALMSTWHDRSRPAGARDGARPVALVVQTFPDPGPRAGGGASS